MQIIMQRSLQSSNNTSETKCNSRTSEAISIGSIGSDLRGGRCGAHSRVPKRGDAGGFQRGSRLGCGLDVDNRGAREGGNA